MIKINIPKKFRIHVKTFSPELKKKKIPYTIKYFTCNLIGIKGNIYILSFGFQKVQSSVYYDFSHHQYETIVFLFQI